MGGDTPAPVIIKRKKVVAGGGHHGGAWKVAYADFVTAMMAFFMLMWLLNATTEKQRKGIADYFNPTIPVNRISGGGEGMFGGDNIFSDVSLARSGTGGSENSSRSSQLEALRAAEEARMQALSEDLLGLSGESDVAEQLRRHVSTRVTDRGLVVDLFDQGEATVFVPGSTELTLLGKALLKVIHEVFSVVDNPLSITGHVPSQPVVLRERDAWEVSTSRAHVARSTLESYGFAESRIMKVAGQADRKPAAYPDISSKNNRLEIVLLRNGISG
ncbi:chemotaxis protein MotB [Dinoroseobacter shibae DFL 12 = DSM 16493]|jgi:chemotaxis protein MotB|uniref:Chemotaxis protein MotB n=1 Tax=Dinoroseobacter shibae (strain DSM 16493 / NCIMB 14021 / DFL 12) TaxID=398580 RepID=A8LNL9_DINSH|nr:flagellar motor protein MotB [Dinoroseobacter shibae]ABV95113.1 chemotaxis protein MotB [Dinoroseobacter shibae DFL 12 = DSM 16493]URF46528.1 flagellar motor protein MotB [Dinoroseobacter shibae]URF50834.1 flagellar motor protein MotB [Dinoroseobacter shibae]